MLMISVNDVMKVLSDYMICDGLYREVDKVEIICRLNQAATETDTKSGKSFIEEEWFE